MSTREYPVYHLDFCNWCFQHSDCYLLCIALYPFFLLETMQFIGILSCGYKSTIPYIYKLEGGGFCIFCVWWWWFVKLNVVQHGSVDFWVHNMQGKIKEKIRKQSSNCIFLLYGEFSDPSEFWSWAHNFERVA